MEEVDKAIAVYKPDSWKAYTIGDPLAPSKFPWRLDDEKVMYPFYEKAHQGRHQHHLHPQGLLPADYEKAFAGVLGVRHRVGHHKAAKDWPQMTFVIYHSALRAFLELPDQAWGEFEQTGRIQWATDLAEIPQKFGVSNVYAGARHVLCQLGGGAPEVLRPRWSARWSRAWGLITCSGAPTRSGTGRRNGRSKRCAVSKFLRTCRRSTVSRHSATPTASPSR